MRTLTSLVLTGALALTLSTSAFASGDAGHGDANGNVAEEHGSAHGGDHGGHHYYTADDDGDGMPNWLDSMNGDVPNEDTYMIPTLGFHTFNLLLLFGILGYAARPAIATTLRTRALHIRKSIEEPAQRREEAQKAYDKLSARLEAIAGEVAKIEADAKAAAINDEAEIKHRAENEAIRIAEAAQRTIRDETVRARNALRKEAVELAVQLAEGVLTKHINHDDQQKLARDFLQSLQGESANA